MALLLFTLFLVQLPFLSFVHPFPFTCGEHVFDYPFGFNNSGHGDLSLQIDCDYCHTLPKPVLDISGKKYYILLPKAYFFKHIMGGTMTIIDKELRDNCDPSSNNYTELRSTSQFHVADTHTDIGLGGHCKREWTDLPNETAPLVCNPDWHYNLTVAVNWAKLCKSQIVLPVKNSGGPVDEHQIRHAGFPIKWNVSERCRDCMLSGGYCGYDISMQFHCKCSHRHFPYADICPAEKSSKKAIILGAAIGGSVLLTATVLFVGFCRKRSSAAKESQLRMMAMEPSLTTVERFLDDYAHEMPTRYSFSQLKKITNNFADKLGEGGFGVVYKGRLARGNLVAVKILNQSRHSETQFINEVATTVRIHHVHLIRLMGYCFDGFRSALVYEYMVNGSLEKFIFAGDKKEEILNGEELYSIALGTARGIAYLHQDCDKRIIHFDIKPHNILLDVDFTPKIADFGLAKLYGRGDDHISMTAARGTPGYAAPEIWNRNLGAVTDKSDAYSFGMLLLEMVGERKNIDLQASRSSQLYFPEWVFKMMDNGQLETGLSGIGKAKCEEMEKAVRLCKVGMWCIQYNSRDRPSMSRVVQMLEGNGDDVSNPPLPFNSAPAFGGEEFSSTV